MREATTATRDGHNLHILWPILNENAAKPKAAGETQIKMYVTYNIDNLWPHQQRNQSRNRQPGDDAERRNSNREELIDPLPLMGIHITSIRLASLYLNYSVPSIPLLHLLSLSSPFIVYLKSVRGEMRKKLKKLICETLSKSTLII